MTDPQPSRQDPDHAAAVRAIVGDELWPQVSESPSMPDIWMAVHGLNLLYGRAAAREWLTAPTESGPSPLSLFLEGRAGEALRLMDAYVGGRERAIVRDVPH